MELSSHHTVPARIRVGRVEDRRVVRRWCTRAGKDLLSVSLPNRVPTCNKAEFIYLGNLREMDMRNARCDVPGSSVSAC